VLFRVWSTQPELRPKITDLTVQWLSTILKRKEIGLNLILVQISSAVLSAFGKKKAENL
jgi:hypothetical protein